MWMPASVGSCRSGRLGRPVSGALIPPSASPLSSPAAGSGSAQFRRGRCCLRMRRSPRPHTRRLRRISQLSSQEPDREHAGELLEALESRGLCVAIDFRDFAPNEHFLSEMERCIKESRFVLCVVTPRYVDSDHAPEEATSTKTLDMSDRWKRLVTLDLRARRIAGVAARAGRHRFRTSASVDPWNVYSRS